MSDDVLDDSTDNIDIFGQSSGNKKSPRSDDEEPTLCEPNKCAKVDQRQSASSTDFKSIDEVPWEIRRPDDPGVFLYYYDEAAIHRALANPAVLPAGLVQGVNPLASRMKLINW